VLRLFINVPIKVHLPPLCRPIFVDLLSLLMLTARAKVFLVGAVGEGVVGSVLETSRAAILGVILLPVPLLSTPFTDGGGSLLS